MKNNQQKIWYHMYSNSSRLLYFDWIIQAPLLPGVHHLDDYTFVIGSAKTYIIKMFSLLRYIH